MNNTDSDKGLIFLVLVILAVIAIPVFIVLNSDYANTTSVLKPVTIKDMRKELKTGDYTYYMCYLTVSDGEQTVEIPVDTHVYGQLKVGNSVYATVHYHNSDGTIAKVVILNEEQYKREMEKLKNGYIPQLKE